MSRARTRPAPAPEAEPIPDASIPKLRRAARGCRRCPLWEHATQTVFGEGPEETTTLMIGEQPGAREDESGHPFVGPSGQMLDRALAELGVDRASIYVTNVVKHFKFEQRGKVRLHKRANAAEQAACRYWLMAELQRVRPTRIVCLGGMAAQAIFGRSFRLLAQRGRWFDLGDGRRAMATVHPSYLLRVPDADRQAAYSAFVRDLRLLKGK